MALIKAGVWHTTVWASRTWQEDLWLEYGTVAPPAAPTLTYGHITRRARAPKKKKVKDEEIMRLFARYLELKVGRDEA